MQVERRSAPRFELGFETNILSNTGRLIGKGLMYDISITGLSFLTNEDTDLQDEQYIAEFSIFQHEVFKLPVKFVRSTEKSRSEEYKYDHAFLFNCDHGSEEIEKLTLSLFKYNMGRK